MKLDSIRKDSRYDLLLRQLRNNNLCTVEEIKQSLDRFCLYLYKHTDIHYFSFVNEKILKSYISYHLSINFEIISFVQVIKDVNNFLFFLRNNQYEINIPKIDLSVENFNLWMRL